MSKQQELDARLQNVLTLIQSVTPPSRWHRTVSWSSTVHCPRTAKPIPTNSPSRSSRVH
jgi:hypothetical protein